MLLSSISPGLWVQWDEVLILVSNSPSPYLHPMQPHRATGPFLSLLCKIHGEFPFLNSKQMTISCDYVFLGKEIQSMIKEERGSERTKWHGQGGESTFVGGKLLSGLQGLQIIHLLINKQEEAVNIYQVLLQVLRTYQ